MEHSFWTERWQKNEIGFHLDERHDFLHQYFHRLHVGPEKVFVPLCGKSPDILWLREQGARVVGVELSELAVESFFAEHALAAKVDARDHFVRYQCAGITLWQGDLLALSRRHLEGARGFYDRGALVALPPRMRAEYAAHLCSILPADCRGLMVSYDYTQDEIDGPPFSVPIREVEALFGAHFNIELLAEQDALPSHQVLRQRGVSKLTEYACLLTPR